MDLVYLLESNIMGGRCWMIGLQKVAAVAGITFATCLPAQEELAPIMNASFYDLAI